MSINKRVAAIDIGSNSVRCIIVEAQERGKFRVLDDEKATVRLGEGIAKDGAISRNAWERSMEALSRMKKIVDGYGVMGIETVATSAVRRASNGPDFVREVGNRLGLTISTISGDEEAELAAASVLNNFDMEGMRYGMVDIGGGSVEIVTALGSHVDEVYSLELGAVVLTEKFISSDPLSEKEHVRLRRHIRKTLKSAFPSGVTPVSSLVGSGGTMTAIAAMVMAMRKEEYGSIHGYEVFRSEVVHLLAMLVRKDLKERIALSGLNPDRADIITAGVMVVNELMELFKSNLLRINERGIREGLIIKGLKKHNLFAPETKPRNWRDAALELARSCHSDLTHSEQVAYLSREIFNSLAETFNYTEKDGQLLETAAILHDIGYFIAYSGHHKHSYHLIRHADLFGFSPREREIIAHVARYHRKSLPKKKHESFARLAPQDQLLVRRLGGILRLADGLDRRRNSIVSAIGCSISKASFEVRLMGSEDLSVELYGGRGKGDLFEKAFSRKLSLLQG